MKIASWNVNSIKARLPAVLEWLSRARPDALCMQEIKCRDEAFPAAEFEQAGYRVLVHGQKGYNGVAIAARIEAEAGRTGLPGAAAEVFGARYLEALLFPAGGRPVRVASLYLPNGNPVGGDGFRRKLEWMERLRAHAGALLEAEEALVLAGDCNIIPAPGDAADIEAWRGDALFHPEALARWRRLVNLGFHDAFRACWRDGGRYSFWDYQGGAWRRGNGIRIDHVLLSPQAMDRLENCDIDQEPRGWDRPSDHAPVWIEMN